MAQGKFSNPRPHRDEDRQIEEAFRQVTGQQVPTQRRHPAKEESDQDLLDLLDQIPMDQIPEEDADDTEIPFEHQFPKTEPKETIMKR